MTTRLDRPLKREVLIGDRPYTVTIAPEGIRVVEKGKRKGRELSWASIVSGDAQLESELRRSIAATATGSADESSSE